MTKEYSQKEIEDTWDSVWQFTDADLKQIFINKLFRIAYKTFRPYIKLSPNSVFLEIGAGTGRYGFAFAQDFPDSEFILTDPTHNSVDYMNDVQRSLELNNVLIEPADATKLHYRTNTFDVVFADCVIQHIPDFNKAMDEMTRVLKPGGQLVISTVNYHNPGHAIYKMMLKIRKREYEYGYERCFSSRELKLELKRRKLENIKLDGFYPEYGILRHKKKSRWVTYLGIVHSHLTSFLDLLTVRRFSKMFGFEVFAIGVKPYERKNSQ